MRTVLAASLLFLSACGGPTIVHVVAERPVNVVVTNERSESTPVSIRIYQLRDDAKFRQAAVDDLWRDSKKVLGDDLVGSEKPHTALPRDKGTTPDAVDLGVADPATKFVGFLALFPEDDEKKARKEIVPAGEATGYTFVLTGMHIEKRK
jgi:type VI secretion system VasD/TssJ family lipoprotein